MSNSLTLRSRVAARMPGPLRKAVRMAEHYVRRQRDWRALMGEVVGATPDDARILRNDAQRAPWTALANLDSFGHPQLSRDVTVDVAGVGRLEVRAGTDDVLHVMTSREVAVRAIIEQTLRPGDVFIDAGANIGFYTLLAARCVGRGGRVFAIEMMPETAARLRHHIALNGLTNVTVIENALAAADGEIVTAISSTEKWGRASIVGQHADDGGVVSHQVATVRLDSVLADVATIALMKIDLEGAELGALAGAASSLERFAKIVFEANRGDTSIAAYLKVRGFKVHSIDDTNCVAQRHDQHSIIASDAQQCTPRSQ